MADKSIFSRLQKLFSTNTIVRKTEQGVKVIDTDEYQNMTTNLVDRFMKLKVTNYGTGHIESSLAYQQVRIDLFRDYDSMDTDPIISAALNVYADECTARNSYGIKRSAETCKKIGETLNYKKANAAWEGSKHSEESKQIIKYKRSQQVMTPWSEERKSAHSNRMKGKAIGNINRTKYFNIIAEKNGEVLKFKNTHEAKKYFGLAKVDSITRVLRKERSMYMGYTWRVEMP